MADIDCVERREDKPGKHDPISNLAGNNTDRVPAIPNDELRGR